MDIMTMTRELGKAIQADERYKAYMTAKEANDNNTELQKLIGDFNLIRMNINQAMSAENKDEENLKKLDEEMRALYAQIMGSEGMIAFNEAQNALEQLIGDVQQIITMCANGEDPDTCQVSHGCSGSCSSCSGCH
ncbi:MAG: YlbF family regulator [Ruminococcus sp.]|nr:YlbF family regulator [Ruminococcus sp.]